MISMSRMGFHEATIRHIECLAGELSLHIDDAFVGTEKLSVTVTLPQVTSITRDGILVDAILMEETDGEVLTFAIDATRIDLIVESNNFQPRPTRIVAYKVQCAPPVIRRDVV